MERNIVLSIIIPVYNVEKYLPRCFESLDTQGGDNIEIIFVDDGALDGSGKLCDKYASKHDNVKVIHKENGGLSDARNCGLKEARGNYCLFLDSDDYLEANICSELIKLLQSKCVDVLYAQIKWIVDEKISIYQKEGFQSDQIYSGEQALALELKHESYAAMAQIGIYNIEFIRKNDLWFKKGILHEDEQWSPRVMLKARTICKVDIPYYNYIIRENSITQSKNKKRYLDMIDTVRELNEIYHTCDNSIIRKYGCQYLTKLYMNAVGHIVYDGEKYKFDRHYILKSMHGLKNMSKAILFNISPKKYIELIGG